MQQTAIVKVVENSWLAKLAAWKLGTPSVALTLGASIHLHKASKKEFMSNERWLRHELAHVEQFRKYGFIRFIWLYAVESVRKGYYMNRFEVEARKKEHI
jgi:Domain of unknown function (DUF4157)